jgi:hypothetical protein
MLGQLGKNVPVELVSDWAWPIGAVANCTLARTGHPVAGAFDKIPVGVAQAKSNKISKSSHERSATP